MLLFLKTNTQKEDFLVYEEFAKFYLFYVLLKRKLPLKFRSHVKIEDGCEFEKEVLFFQQILIDVLQYFKTVLTQSYFKHISDIWDGNLFMTVALNMLENFWKNEGKLIFEDDVLDAYKCIMTEIFNLVNIPRDVMLQFSDSSPFIAKLRTSENWKSRTEANLRKSKLFPSNVIWLTVMRVRFTTR